MNDKLWNQLAIYRNEADRIDSETAAHRWSDRVIEFLKQALGSETAAKFSSLTAKNIYDELALKCGYIEGLIARGGVKPPLENSEMPHQSTAGIAQVGMSSRRVFVVHGHDSEVKGNRRQVS